MAQVSEHAPPEAPGHAGLWPPRAVLLRLVGWYGLSRLVVWTGVAAGWSLRPDLSLYALVRRLDASWYIGIAKHGYSVHAATPAAIEGYGGEVLRGAFSPLWPLLIRVLRLPGVPLEASATVLAMVLGFGVVLASWMVMERLTDRDTADRAAVLVAFFPGSVVFSIAYAEGLMLCLVVGCLFALLQRRWLLAGVLGALATAARPNAIALVPACLWAAVAAVRRDGDWRSAAAPLLAPVGVLGFHAFLWWRTDHLDAWRLSQRNGWDEGVDLGAGNLGRLTALLRWDDPDPGTIVIGAGLVVLLAGVWALWRWRPPAVLTVYVAGVAGLALVARTLGPRPRFLLTALPLVWALAVWLRREHLRVALLACSAGLAAAGVFYIVGSAAKL